MVTVFRTSRAEGASASAAPQDPQKRNPSGFSAPQLGQTVIRASVTGTAQNFDANRPVPLGHDDVMPGRWKGVAGLIAAATVRCGGGNLGVSAALRVY